jgi:hypothetical protein
MYISHFCLLPFPLSFALTSALSLFGGIYRRRVMTRKERGEDVYECMLGRTLNDESSQKSNPINCTKKRKEEYRERWDSDGILYVM